MASAVDLRRDLHARVAAANIKSAYAFGPINLVARERQHVDVVGQYVDWNLAHGLHSVGMEEHALLMAELADFANRLQHANLVIGSHDRDQNRLLVDGAFQ